MKYIIQWFSVYSENCTAISSTNFFNIFVSSKRNSVSIAVTPTPTPMPSYLMPPSPTPSPR